MRGGANNETLVTLDGFALYEPFHLKLLLSPTSLLDPGILSGIDVHAGGFTADFGDRMSSVIEATSIHPEADQQYEIGLSLFNASLVAFNRFAGRRRAVAGRGPSQQPRRDRGPGRRLLRRDCSYSDAFGRLDYAFYAGHARQPARAASTDTANVTNAQDTETSAADYRNSYVWGTLEHDFSPALQCEGHRLVYLRRPSRHGEVDEDGVRRARRRRATLRRAGLQLDATSRPTAG